MYLLSFCYQNQHGWNRFLPWAEYAQNSLRQHSTGLTPFQCVFGYQPPLFPWDGEPLEVPALDFWFKESKRVWDSAHVQLQQAVRRHKTHADACRLSAPPNQPGDRLSTRDICLRLPGLSVHSPSGGRSTRLLTSWTCHPPTVSHTFYVSLLKPHTNSMSPSSPGPDKPEIPPPPEIDNDESIYRVNFILYSQSAGGRLEYLMDWEGFGPKERCWVPRDDILDPSLLSEFHQLHPHKPASRGRSRPGSGRQEPPMEEGVLLEYRQPRQFPTISQHDYTHLYSNHSHRAPPNQDRHKANVPSHSPLSGLDRHDHQTRLLLLPLVPDLLQLLQEIYSLSYLQDKSIELFHTYLPSLLCGFPSPVQ